MATWSKAGVGGYLLVGIVCSTSAVGMDVVSCVCCVCCQYRYVHRDVHSFRRVLPNVMCAESVIANPLRGSHDPDSGKRARVNIY